MEAEYVALSTSCKDLFPIVDMIRELCSTIGLDVNAVANMHIKFHEDNVGALTLAGLEPQRMTPRSSTTPSSITGFGSMCIHIGSNC